MTKAITLTCNVFQCICSCNLRNNRSGLNHIQLYTRTRLPIRGQKEVPRSAGHVATRYSNQPGSESRQNPCQIRNHPTVEHREFTHLETTSLGTNYSFYFPKCVCVFSVCVFFPLILDIKFVGRTSRGHTGGRSHRISHPPSFCGACLNFSPEKDSAIPFPRRPGSRILCTNDLIVLHPLGIFIFVF